MCTREHRFRSLTPFAPGTSNSILLSSATYNRAITNPRKIGDLPHRWKKGTWRKKRQAIEHAIFDESDRRRSASLGRSGRRNIARLSYRLLDRATTVVSVATCSNHLRDLALHRIILTRMIASSKRSSRRDAPCEATRAPSS